VRLSFFLAWGWTWGVALSNAPGFATKPMIEARESP
jgi:hypothetical protein